jgi:hypothetical protein
MVIFAGLKKLTLVMGNNKSKLPYSDQVLFLAIHAAIRLHNFIMNSEQVSYSALESVDNMYVNYY